SFARVIFCVWSNRTWPAKPPSAAGGSPALICWGNIVRVAVRIAGFEPLWPAALVEKIADSGLLIAALDGRDSFHAWGKAGDREGGPAVADLRAGPGGDLRQYW